MKRRLKRHKNQEYPMGYIGAGIGIIIGIIVYGIVVSVALTLTNTCFYETQTGECHKGLSFGIEENFGNSYKLLLGIYLNEFAILLLIIFMVIFSVIGLTFIPL